MTKSVYKRRIRALRERLSEIKPDTAWIIQPENRQYLSGFSAEDSQLNESSGSLFINDKVCLLVTDSRYSTEAQKEAPDFKVITAKRGLLEVLPTVMENLETQCLGFEEDHLTWGLHQQVRRTLRKMTQPPRITPLKGVVEDLRIIKDKAEIRAMEASSNLMCRILGEVIPSLEPGRTEKEIAWQIEGLAKEGGADSLAFPSIVASGPNSALPHAVPTNRKIRAKEPITLDVGVRIKGYRCDMTRTIFLERPGPKMRKIYRTVREAQLAAMPEVRPGVKSNVPDKKARDLIKDAGFGEYFGHALGHGVGLATHEVPRLGPEKPVTLEKGMVVTVEPGIYIPRSGGVRLEEMVVIEKDGPRILTRDDHFYEF